MKSTAFKIMISGCILSGIFSCSKSETSASYSSEISADSAAVSESVSSAAGTALNGRQFLKTASVDMEVKDVYAATVSIEKTLKDLGGFVTSSHLATNVLSSETFNTSDTQAVLIKKSQAENRMRIRIPAENLSEFLQNINSQKLFLNTRIISAEDVSAKLKYAELESKRAQAAAQNITQLKNTADKVKMADQNLREDNDRQVSVMTMTDQIQYSTVDIYIKEPQLRIAEIPVANIRNIDNQYKFNFLYDAKNAFVEGFYLIQSIIVGLIRIWPLILLGTGIFFLIRSRKIRFTKPQDSATKP